MMSSIGQPRGPRPRTVLFVGLLFAQLEPASVRAQVLETARAPDSQDQEGVVNFPVAFFSRYQPYTALDMVQQIPGFQLDNGSRERGFGASAGNILINDRRLSAKQDQPSSILARIPASHVESIDLIRGQAGNIDMLGQSMVANVLLRGDMSAAVRWEASLLKNFIDPSLDFTDLAMDISRSDRWRNIEYNTGVTLSRRGTGDDIVAVVLDGDGNLIEERLEEQEETSPSATGNLNLSTMLGRTLLQVNGKLAWTDFATTVVSDRTPVNNNGEPRQETFGRDNEFKQIEVGVDAERSLSGNLIGKGIVLFFQNDGDAVSTQRIVEDAAGQTLFRVADSNVKTTEAITRLEFDWTGWHRHAVQINIEGAKNVIDGTLLLTVDTGSGPVVVDVPGGNTRVEELRGDLLVKDTWSLGEWVVDYGLGAEFSEISQTGDFSRTRKFSFIKPQGLVTWSPRQGVQTRLRVAREVAQLNLNDFVTTTQFQDENLLLGGQDLEPESTWITELTYERRFGELGVVSLKGFHHWISDAQDFVPLTDDTDAPGNIGDGRRWGVAWESTLPLEGVGLTGARLDLKARWQDSTVVDPVTGMDRILTGRSEQQGPPTFSFNVLDFRQEPHSYIAGIPITWFRPYVSDRELGTDEMMSLEDDFIDLLKSTPLVQVDSVKWTGGQDYEVLSSELIGNDTVLSNAEMVEKNGARYMRFHIPVVPNDRQVAEFEAFVEEVSDQDLTLYFNCWDGTGRSTEFMVMYDILKNGGEVSLKTIADRQAAMGGINVLKLPPQSSPNYPRSVLRRDFIIDYYQKKSEAE